MIFQETILKGFYVLKNSDSEINMDQILENRMVKGH